MKIQIELEDVMINATDAKLAEVVRAQLDAALRFKPCVGDFIRHRNSGDVWLVSKVNTIMVEGKHIAAAVNLTDFETAGQDGSLSWSAWELVVPNFA